MSNLKKIITTVGVLALMGGQEVVAQHKRVSEPKDTKKAIRVVESRNLLLANTLLPEPHETRKTYEKRLEDLNKSKEQSRQTYENRYKENLKNTTSAKEKERLKRHYEMTKSKFKPAASIFSKEGQQAYVNAQKSLAEFNQISYEVREDPNLIWVLNAGGIVFSSEKINNELIKKGREYNF